MNENASRHTQLVLVALPEKKDLQFAYLRTSIYRDGMYRTFSVGDRANIIFFPDKNQIGKKK